MTDLTPGQRYQWTVEGIAGTHGLTLPNGGLLMEATLREGEVKSLAHPVGDGLLRDLVEQADQMRDLPGGYRRVGEAFLASEPMVRLFSIWTATVAAQRDQYADQWEAAQRERDEAYRQKTEWQATAGRLAAERDAAYQEAADARDRITERERMLQAERDEARAGWTAALAAGQNQVNLVTDLRVEVERLGQQNESERQHVDWLVEKEEIADRFKAESDRVLGEIGELRGPSGNVAGDAPESGDGPIREALRVVLPEITENGEVTYPSEGHLDTFIGSLATLGYAITPIDERSR